MKKCYINPSYQTAMSLQNCGRDPTTVDNSNVHIPEEYVAEQ